MEQQTEGVAHVLAQHNTIFLLFCASFNGFKRQEKETKKMFEKKFLKK